ncbi:MAG: UvrD-helicase domain-containing protein, partial [Succinatimonas hippei]|nr:UvrD-helicase domain-containing protein [Succinatimonas hippei]
MSDLDLLDSAPVADESKILEGLNDSQKEAVSSPLCNALIIAGAGTGKTRVLVSRIVYLISHYQVKARNILAVTFTNKAAKEMRERIGMYLNANDTHHLWANTFHSTCLRLLRAYATQAGLTPGFLILDTDGQNSLVKRIMLDLKMDIKEIKPSEFASRISSLKEKGMRADDFQKRVNYIKYTNKKKSGTIEKLALVYSAYERICNQENSVDFAEILLRTVELLRSNSAIREIQ